MTKTFKGFLCGMVLISLVLSPACRTTKKQPPKTETVATTTTQAPPPVATTVPTDTDFVKPEPEVRAETLPADIEELNRLAQSRGFIRDAFFGYDEAGLSSEAQEALAQSANWLKQNTQYNLLIEGHCDERGTEQYNLALGDRRAHTAREYLVTLGVDTGRIRTVSYGEERPFNDGHDESSWAQNRRAHLVLVGR